MSGVLIRHTGLVVRNLDVSLAFYTDFFGFKLVNRQVESGPYIDSLVGIPQVRLEWAKMTLPGGGMLELLQYHSHPDLSVKPTPTPSNTHGCSQVALTVTNIDALYQKLVAGGYHTTSAPLHSPDGKVKVLYCQDPDNIILEIVEELPL